MMSDVRLDTLTATVVNKGLATALLGDLRTAVKLMSDAGVPPAVVARVVLHPQQRRASDWKQQ